MEAQNHFYGHSAAFAAYLGLGRPRHVRGLVQHGWTTVSPVGTHFRDFPDIGRSHDDRRRLLVWSHDSRAWNPADDDRESVAIGAQLAYLAKASGRSAAARDARDRVVLMPVHGIQTQRVRGDHHALAQSWRDAEGPATACLYASDAADPEILAAYRSAGHRVVVLGERLDPEFLWRLWTLLSRAGRVVSNRLSTPVFYASHLGADVAVYGDTMRLEGEDADQYDRVRQLWPELHAENVDGSTAREVADRELGVSWMREPADLAGLLGWDRSTLAPATQYWSTSVVQRAVINLRRKAAAAPSGHPPAAEPASDERLSFLAWLRGATSYLPRPLPRRIAPAGTAVEPFELPGETPVNG